MVNDKFLTKKISEREKEDRISELLHWVKSNLKDEDISSFTAGEFTAAAALIEALQQTYQVLGVRGEKGLESDFVLFIAGDRKNKIYVSYCVPLTEAHKNIFLKKLGAQLEGIDQNLSKLTWR
jgi:hypothetical protein